MTTSLRPVACRAAFDALLAMAWADGQLTRDEILAMQDAARVLGLPADAIESLDDVPPRPETLAAFDLEDDERRAVYLAAAWLAWVDRREDGPERSLLGEIAEALDLEEDVTRTLDERAKSLRDETPAIVPWWQEVERLFRHLGSS